MKHSPDFIDISGNFLTDFGKSKTGPDSVPSSPGALFTLTVFRKQGRGSEGCVTSMRTPWESLSGCPISLVSALSCHWACPVASRDEHLLPGEPFALAE